MSNAAAITTADTSTNNERDRVEWSRTTILGFIEDYRRQRVLWDPNTKGYHIKQTKYEALKALGYKYGTEIRSIRSKIKSLRSSFHREHGKVINGRRRGVDYQPMWFAYEAIRFILDGESTATSSHGSAVVIVDSSQQQQQAALDGGVAGVGNVSVLLGKTETAATFAADADLLEEKFSNIVRGGGAIVVDEREGVENDEDAKLEETVEEAAEEKEADKVVDNNKNDNEAAAVAIAAAALASKSLKVVTRAVKSAAAAAAVINKATVMKTATAAAVSATTTTTATTIATPLNATTSTHAAAAAAAANYTADCNSNSIVARVAAAVAAAAAAATIRSSNNDEFAVSRNDFDCDLQNYFCNISADDVKTELIESDSTDLTTVVRPMRLSTPSPINYSKQNEIITPTASSNRKRKSHAQQIDHSSADDLPTPSKQQQPQQQQQQQHSNSSYARQRDLSPAVTTVHNNASTSSSTSNNAHNNNTKTHNTPTDEYGVFGEYVAITIRKLKTSKSKIVVKHLINNLLYEAEMGKYDHGIPASKEPPQLYKLG